VGLVFATDTLDILEPRWQFDRARTREFAPAFASAGAFLVVVAAGVAGMVRLRYPPARAPLSPAQAETFAPERIAVARDLRVASLVTIALALALWWIASVVLASFGFWPLAVPAGLIAGSAVLLGAARWASRAARRASTGVE
jgi:hypothetical protein